MVIKLSTIKLLTPVCIFLLLAATASATPLKLTVHDDFFGFNNIEVTFNDKKLSVDAGELQVSYSGSYTSGLLPAFCVDLDNFLNYGENDIEGFESPEDYTTNGRYVEWLFNYALSPEKREYTNRNDYAGAGLQLAIWEVLYDFDINENGTTDYNLRNDEGIFWYNNQTSGIDSEDMTAINEWYDSYINTLLTNIDNISGSSYTPTDRYTVVELSSDGNDTQDLITKVVPEPGTILLFGIGLLGLGAVGRRR